MPAPPTILLVGFEMDRPRELQAASHERMLDWSFLHARGFLEAMALLATKPCDAVVADLALPGFSGAQLLVEVMHRFPRTRRFLVAERHRLPASPKCAGAAHEIWPKPIQSETLLDRLASALARAAWSPGEAAQRLIARLPSLPPLPELYFKLEEARRREALSATQFEAILEGFPGPRRHYSRWTAPNAEGRARIAPAERNALALLAHLRAFFEHAAPRADLLETWETEALMTARFAREIARTESRDPAVVRDTVLAGLLHDVGGLLLDINHPERAAVTRRWARQKAVSLWQAEHEILGTTHAELGACLLSGWGLPWAAVEAVARHHEGAPAEPRPCDAASAVQAAIGLVAQWREAHPPEESAAPVSRIAA